MSVCLMLSCCFLALPLMACAQSSLKVQSQEAFASESTVTQCQISETERESLLNLDYNSFDQSLPNGGWRKFQHCTVLARDLIDAYTSRHESTLQKQQWDVLVWHSGQISATADDDIEAIAKMERTLKPNERPTDAFLWNPYAKATIAFLKRDRAALLSERKKLDRGFSPFNRINLRIVDFFIRCFNSSYLEAYSGTCRPPETNISRIQSLAIPFNLNKPFPREFFGLSDFLKMKRVIIVGEMHGTESTPRLFANMVATVASPESRTLVLLEISQSSQESVDAFLKTSDDSVLKADPFFNRKHQDGRSSRAIVDLLRRLAKLPNTKVLCMDPASESTPMTAQDRDTRMAEFINSKRTGHDHTFILAGNLHSSTSIGTPWDKTYRPMGYELKRFAKDLGESQLLNILVRYGKLSSWSCQASNSSGGPSGFDASNAAHRATRPECKVHHGSAVPTDYSMAVSHPSYFVWETPSVDGHHASIFIRETKASLPLTTK